MPGKINLRTFEVTYAMNGAEHVATKYRTIDGTYLPFDEKSYVCKNKNLRCIFVNKPRHSSKFFFGVGRHAKDIWVPGKVMWDEDEAGNTVLEEKLVYTYCGKQYETTEF